MKVTTDKLWLFDYSDGAAYEAFSKCEDSEKKIANYLVNNYRFQGKEILEIGAGSGKFTPLLASGKILHVVERSKSLMEINYRKNHAENVRFYLSDMKDVSFAEKSNDIIFGGWSLTSMRDSFDQILPILKKILKDDGKIILLENAGDDEFSEIAGIEELSLEMRNFYRSIGFEEKALLDTTIVLPNEGVFYSAFPNKLHVSLNSLTIRHRVLILEAKAQKFYGGGCNENS